MAEEIELTSGEKLFLWRRRKGMSQNQAAKHFKMSRRQYLKMEFDQAPSPTITLGQLTPQEKCIMYRRHSGMTQLEVAEELKVTRLWVNHMENGKGSIDTLLWYWEA